MKRAVDDRSGSGFDWNQVLSAETLERHLQAGHLPADGSCDLAAMPRLAREASLDGPIRWRFFAGTEAPGTVGGHRIWKLETSARLSLVCERCLEPVIIALETARGFVFMSSAAEADAFQLEDQGSDTDPPDDDQLDAISPEDRQSLRDLLEDELLLGIPMAPMHQECDLPAGTGNVGGKNGDAATPSNDDPQSHPFAGLKALLKKP